MADNIAPWFGDGPLMRHYGEPLLCTIAAEVGEAHVDFKVYEIVAWTPDELVYESVDETLAGARVFIKGYVKWDHCSNWEFDGGVHGCNQEHLLRLGQIPAACWEWAKELMADKWFTL